MNIDARIEALRGNIESLHVAVGELVGGIAHHDAQIADLITAGRQDGENIRALARIAEIHERRLTDLEGGK